MVIMEYSLTINTNKPTRYMRELRCALADIFTKCGTNTTRKKQITTGRIIFNANLTDSYKEEKMESTIPKINYDIEPYTERTLAFGIMVKDAIWMIDRLNEFGYDVISVTQDNNIWKPKDAYRNTIVIYSIPNHYYFKVRKIEEVDLLV